MIYIKLKKLLYLNLIFFLFCSLTACSYSFTGASIPPHIKSIAIPLFKDNTGGGEPELKEKFTNVLIKKFLDDNQLRVVPKANSDALLECTVTGLSDGPAVVAGGEQVTFRRITITVKILYRDLVKKTTIIDKNFTDFSDYSTEGDITIARKKAIDDTIEKISEDILINVVSNW